MFYWVAKNSNRNSLLISMLKLKRFKIEKRYTIKLFYISQKFKRGSLLPSIHVDTLKLKKRRVLKKRNNFSRAGNRKYLIMAVKRWLVKRLLYREPKCDVDFCRLHGKFEVPKAKTQIRCGFRLPLVLCASSHRHTFFFCTQHGGVMNSPKSLAALQQLLFVVFTVELLVNTEKISEKRKKQNHTRYF